MESDNSKAARALHSYREREFRRCGIRIRHEMRVFLLFWSLIPPRQNEDGSQFRLTGFGFLFLQDVHPVSLPHEVVCQDHAFQS